MIRFDKPSHSLTRLVCVDVQSIEEFADVVEWFEFLKGERCGISGCGRRFLTSDFLGLVLIWLTCSYCMIYLVKILYDFE